MKRKFSLTPLTFVGIFLLAAMFSPSQALGELDFIPVGPRATGMGSVGVAVTTDAFTTVWNPAGMALEKNVDVRITGTIVGINRNQALQRLSDLNDIDRNNLNAGNIANAQALVNALTTQGTSLQALLNAGLYFKGYWGDHFIGVKVSDDFTSGLFLPVPVNVTVTGGQLTAEGAVALNGIQAQQVGFSYAYAFLERTISFGITVNVIRGVTYINQIGAFAAADDNDQLIQVTDDLGSPTTSLNIGLDLGVLWQPLQWFRLGIIGRNLNNPAFDTKIAGRDVELSPQARGGLALFPWPGFTLGVDVDMTANRTIVSSVRKRSVNVGMEQTLFSELLALRAGLATNVDDSKTKSTPTAGLGLWAGWFRLDMAAGYDFDLGTLTGSLALGGTF